MLRNLAAVEINLCGIRFGSQINAKVVNNIISFNSEGIYSYGSTVTLRYNCVYGNIPYDYYEEISPGNSDISIDPKFVDTLSGNYHLLVGSPCIDKGDDSIVKQGWMDIDGQPRIKGEHVDIGADEFH